MFRLFTLLLLFPLAIVVMPAILQDISPPEPFTSAQQLFRTGYFAVQSGDYATALTAFRRFAAEAPESPLIDYAYFYIGESLLKTSSYSDARTMLGGLSQRFPRSLLLPDVPFLIAESYAAQAQYESAIHAYLAIEKDKNAQSHRWLPEGYLHLGDCYERTNQLTAARAIYHEAQMRFIKQPAYPLAKEREEQLLIREPTLRQQITLKERLETIETLLDNGRANDAVPILALLSAQPLTSAQRQATLLNSADAHYALRNNAEALALFEDFLKKYSQSASVPYALERMARTHLRQQDWAAFLQIEARLRKNYPTNTHTAEVLRLKGKELELQHKFSEALAEYTAFQKFFPKSSLLADILWRTGWVQYQIGHYKTAVDTWDQYVRRYPRSKTRNEVLYWIGRAEEQRNHAEQAGAAYLKAFAEQPNSYYGDLSRQALARLAQNHPTLNQTLPAPTAPPLPWNETVAYTTERGTFHYANAQALLAMNLYPLAVRELAYAVNHEKTDLAKTLELARLYQQAGKYAELVRLMQRSFWTWIAQGDDRLPREFWELCYPLSFYPIVAEYTSGSRLDPFQVLAQMLAESEFDPDAYDAIAGGGGLMQIMPAAGARLAERLKLPAPGPADYFNPRLNIQLGVAYLNLLLPMFDGHLPPVIASYNAGEHVVSAWWQTANPNDEPAFVASIPYDITKRYVQKVLWYYREYRRVYQ